ncbi:MAG: hypothetical protein IKA48_02035 [Fibrobacter sp.]|nr:hypothetical protein [Fibrobacter sp.]
MEKQLMEAHINSSGASKTEIANSFNESYDVIRQIAKKYNNLGTNGGSLVDQVTYVVTFVHPELKPLNRKMGETYSGFMNTPNSIFNNYAVEIPVNAVNGQITESKLPYLNHPMVSLLNAVSAGVLNKALNAQPKGAFTDDDSSAFGAEAFDRWADDMQEDILNNSEYTTKGFIDTKIASIRPSGATPAAAAEAQERISVLTELKDQIDEDSLFGFHRDDVTHDPNGDDAWGILENLEHWFYALVVNNLTLENQKAKGDSDELGESVFTYVKALRALLTDSDVASALHAIDARIMNPSIGDVEIADRGELHLDGNLLQLGVLICMSAKSTAGDAQNSPLADYLLDMVRHDDKYTHGVYRILDFIDDPYISVDNNGEAGEPEHIPLNLKVGTDKWTVGNLAALAQRNAQEYDNPSAAKLAKQLGQKQQPISATLEKLARSGIATRTIKGKYPIVSAIASMIAQYVPDDATENLESGLVADPETAGDLIGIKGNLDKEVKTRMANINKPSLDLQNEFLNQSMSQSKMNLLTNDEMEVSLLDPKVDDVQGSVILPKWAIPLFSTKVQFEKGDDENEQIVSNLASVLIAYLAIRYKDTNIKTFPWLDIRKVNGTDENGETSEAESRTVVEIAAGGDDGQMLKIQDIEVAEAIETYFKWLVTESTDPSNIVRLRNEWVDALNEPESWGTIMQAVLQYMQRYIERTVQVTTEESQTANEALKQKLLNALEETIIPGAKEFVNRNIFNVKEGSRDVQLTNDLIANSVKPISPINLSENGRLRESGGEEGSVTSDGKKLLNNTMGRVVNVKRSKDGNLGTGGTVGNNTYKVHFKNGSGLVTGEFTDSMVDTWIPDGLVVMVDSSSKSPQYALWVGVNFVDIQTMEGNLGSFRTSPEEIGASNAAYMNSVVGSPSYKEAMPNAVSAGGFLDTVSAPALGAIRRAGDIIHGMGGKTFNQIYEMLRYVVSSKYLVSDEEFDNAIQMREIGKKSAEKAASDIFGGVSNVFVASKMEIEGDSFYCDLDSVRTIHELTALCGESVYKKYRKPCLMRLSSALTSLTEIPEVADHPFVIENIENNRIEIGNNGEELSHMARFDAKGNGQAFASLIDELNANAHDIEDALQNGDDNLDGLYATTMDNLNELASMFDAEFRQELSVPANTAGLRKTQLETEQTIAKYAPLLTSQEACDTLATIIGNIMPELRQSPEVMNRTILDVFNSTYYARQLPGDLAQSREPHNNYDRHAGTPSQKVLTGDEVEDIVTPDYNGENDDFSGSKLVSSFDHDELMDYDTDNATHLDFDGISSQYPMLNKIACDPRGMYSGNGSFNVSTGISAPEFEQVAAALDSAHETLAKVEGGAVGKNVPINLFTTGKNYCLDKIIDAFYGFMASQKELDKRNILSDALETGTALEAAVDECGDITVKPMANKVLAAYRKVVAGVEKDLRNAYEHEITDEENILRLEDLTTRKIATAIANIVLYLNSELETEMPTTDPTGLEVYGKRNRSGYDINSSIADKFATASAINPDANRTNPAVNGKNILSVTKTRMSKEIRSKFRDSMDYGVNEVERFADTLTNIYERIGKSATLGYENAISPFDDLLGKSQSKHDKPYKTLYTGESLNDLGAVIMFAIVSDERNRNPGVTSKYGMLETIIGMLTGDGDDATADEAGNKTQSPVPVPKYLIKGLYTVDDVLSGAKSLDYNTIVWAMFGPDGSSVISNLPNSGFNAHPRAFAGLAEIGEAIHVPLSDDDTINEAVSKIRTAIIERKLDNNSALDTLARKDAGTNKKIYADTISNFVDTMLAAARGTLETPTVFVPLSVLYTCLDDKALNTAMHNTIEHASDKIRQQQRENASNEIMRSVVGNEYGEIPDVGTIAAENEEYIVNDLANAIRVIKDGVGTPQSNMRTAIGYQNSNEIDGEDIPIPGSSLREIFGTEKAEECVRLMMQQVPMHVLAALDDEGRHEHARSFVRAMIEKNNVVDASEPLARIANDLVSIADGATPASAALKDITATIGARNQALAFKLAQNYFKNLGVNMPTGRNGISDNVEISPSRMRNVALHTVNRELNTKGEFRSLFLHKYPTEGNTALQARKIMHGKVHPFGTASIGDANSLSVMYEKVKNALNGTMDADEAAELLSGVFFNIDGVTGSAAIKAFNKYFKTLKEKLASVVRSTFTGVDAQLKLNAGNSERSAEYAAKVDANRCASGTELAVGGDTHTNGDGPARALALKKLDEAKQLIISALGKHSSKSIAMFNSAVDAFLAEHCMWSTNMSDEELTEVKNASKTLNNRQLDADYVTLRDNVARAFATSDDRYQRDVKSVVGMSSSATGINVDFVLPPSKLKTLADTMATIKDSPIQHADSDMYDADYLIDGKPVSWDRCMVILNSALDMCDVPTPTDPNTPVRDLITEELFQCVRRCASSVRDLPLMPDSIASILLSTMFKKKLITLSPIDGCVRMKHRFSDSTRNGNRRPGGWFGFDIPVPIVYSIVEDKISRTDLSKSLNEWKAFSDEVDKFTNTGNRLNSYKFTNHELGNQLWDLFTSVQNTLIEQIDGYLSRLSDEDYETLCESRNGMDTDDGIHITKSRVDFSADDDAANAFRARRRLRNDEYEDRSQEIEFPERFPREQRPFREPEEPDEPIAPEPEAPAESAGPAPEAPEAPDAEEEDEEQ